MDEVEAVADNDQWQLLGQLSLLQEVLDLLWVEVSVVAANTLHLVELLHLGRGLNVLEYDIWLLADVDDAAEIIVESLSSLVFLEQVDESGGTQQIRILRRNADNGLEILANVRLQIGRASCRERVF